MANRLGCGKQPIPSPPDKITHTAPLRPRQKGKLDFSVIETAQTRRRSEWNVSGCLFCSKVNTHIVVQSHFSLNLQKGTRMCCVGGTGLLMPITIVQVGVKRPMIKTHKKESRAHTEAVSGEGAALSKWRVGLALSKIHKMETNDCSFCTHGLGDSRTFRNAQKQ